jgi:hypothetical protein
MRTVAVLLVYLVALVFGTYQAFGPMIGSRFVRTQTERGDGMLNHYILEHTWQAVSNPGYRGSLFSPPCFFPEPYTLWYSEHLLGIAPLYWSLRLALPDDIAYQWWQILTNALNFVAFGAAARWLRVPHVLAILGGYLWAFGPVHIDQIKHQQLIPRFWMPLAVYHAWAFALAPAARSLNRMLACVFLQSVSCVYTGWFLVTGLAVFLPVAVWLRRGGWNEVSRFVRENRRQVGRIVAAWAYALLVAFLPYLVVNWGIVRGYGECDGLIPTPSAWLTGPPGTPWYETTAPYRAPVSEECRLFCGFGLYALMLAALYLSVARRPGRSPDFAAAAAAVITACVWVLIALTPRDEGHSLWEIVRHVPGGTALRCVSRVYVTVYLFGTLGALVWLARMTETLRPWPRAALLTLIAGVIVFEQLGYEPPSFDKKDFYAIADRTADRLRGAEAAYVVPRYTDTNGEHLRGVYGDVLGMWAGLRANVPVVNGYSGRWPSGDYPGGQVATDEELRAWLAGKFRGKLTIVDPEHPEATRVIVIE